MKNEIPSNENCKLDADLAPQNNYSIYDYLKTTPSLLIAILSALVATITFFAKTNTLILSKKELAFWEFSTNYSTFGNDSILYTALLSIIHFILLSLSYCLVAAIIETYIPYKKYRLIQKYYIQDRKKYFNSSPTSEQNDDYKANFDVFNKLQTNNKKFNKQLNQILSINLFFVLILIIFNSVLYLMTANFSGKSYWENLGISILAQIVMIFIFTRITFHSKINKKDLKKYCSDYDYIMTLSDSNNLKEFPINILFKKGVRFCLSNSNIIIIILMIIINCFLSNYYITSTNINPIEKSNVFQTTTIDNISYAIVYQNENQYFLEEIDIDVTYTPNSVLEKTLIIYTDCQRIVTLSDISINIDEYDKILKEHKTK